MQYRIVALATVLSGLAGTVPAFAQTQTVPPLSYMQPLPQTSVQAVQDRLRQAGVYSGSVDGIWGPDSATALQRFQATHQLQPTGQMNQATAATLGMDPTAMLVVAQPPAPPPPLPGSTLRPASVRTVQARLKSLGFYGGPVDGVWGATTQTAIERFQQGRGLQANGQINPVTVSAMGLPPDIMVYQ